MNEKKIYVIVGSYLQEAGYKILRAYTDKEKAQKDLDMILDVDVCGREWKLEEVELIEAYPVYTQTR